MSHCQLRVARPVSDLAVSRDMYRAGLGLQIIAEFSDHQGFSGVMLGYVDHSWHLEFTVCHQHPLPPVSSAEDLLVLYFPQKAEWQAACDRMIDAGFRSVESFNPYWSIAGQTFIDPDGYRTVIQNQAWPIP